MNIKKKKNSRDCTGIPALVSTPCIRSTSYSRQTTACIIGVLHLLGYLCTLTYRSASWDFESTPNIHTSER